MSALRLIESLPQLVAEGLITTDQAERIRQRFDHRQPQGGDRLMLLFSILGGALIGIGILLVVAHNWEDLSRGMRTFFAFLPLLIGQALVLFTLLRKAEARGWREGASIFLLLAVGACLALISQIYHIPGELDGFLLTWSLLVVALLYLPGSVVSLILYLGMITWYATIIRYDWRSEAMPWMYLPLLAIAMPAYIKEARERGESVSFFWASAAIALSIGVAASLFLRSNAVEAILAIAGMATAYILLPTLIPRSIRLGAFTFLGSATMIILLFMASYHEIWFSTTDPLSGHDLIPVMFMIVIGILAFILSLRSRRLFEGGAIPESFLVLLIAYLAEFFSAGLSALIVNLWTLGLGIQLVRSGIHVGTLSRMNLGLGIISVIVVLRFFDLNIDDALKGIVFILLGIGFLALNVRLIRQRKANLNA